MERASARTALVGRLNAPFSLPQGLACHGRLPTEARVRAGRVTGTLGLPRRKQRRIYRFQNLEFDDFQLPIEPNIALDVNLRGRLYASKVLVVAVNHLLCHVEIHGCIVEEQRLSYRLER